MTIKLTVIVRVKTTGDDDGSGVELNTYYRAFWDGNIDDFNLNPQDNIRNDSFPVRKTYPFPGQELSRKVYIKDIRPNSLYVSVQEIDTGGREDVGDYRGFNTKDRIPLPPPGQPGPVSSQPRDFGEGGFSFTVEVLCERVTE